MLASILRRKKKDFLEHINWIWEGYGEVEKDDFNKIIGNSEDSETVIKFISQLTEKLYGEKLAAKLDHKGHIIGWQFYEKTK